MDTMMLRRETTFWILPFQKALSITNPPNGHQIMKFFFVQCSKRIPARKNHVPHRWNEGVVFNVDNGMPAAPESEGTPLKTADTDPDTDTDTDTDTDAD
jgi:hypothetical protein